MIRWELKQSKSTPKVEIPDEEKNVKFKKMDRLKKNKSMNFPNNI